MKSQAMAWFTASVLLATDALGQENDSEIRTTVIDDFPVASPEVRSLAIKWRLDHDHDQYVTMAELDAVILETSRSITAGEARRRLLGPNRYIWRHVIKWSELLVVRQAILAAGVELSLVSEDFHERFTQLSSEQRHALLKADADGNNDGMVTAPEFGSYNQRLFRKKARFESDFGEDAYLDVLQALGVL